MPATKPNIAELVARMPDVDPPKPPEPRKKQETDPADQKQTQKSEAPPEPPPDPNRPGKFTGPAPALAKQIFDEVIAGGSDSFAELLKMVHAPGDPDFQNYKAAYLLHGLAIYAGQTGREKQRRLLSDSLVSAIAEKRSKSVKAFFIQELQTAGAKEAVSALGKQLLDDELNEPATRALLAIRDGAAAQFRNALPKVKGRNRLNIMQALGVIADATSVAALKQALASDESDVRVSAASALANIGEPSVTDSLLASADKAEGSERIQLTDACFQLAEKLGVAGKKNDASRIYLHLRTKRTDESERYIREAAERALNQRQQLL